MHKAAKPGTQKWEYAQRSKTILEQHGIDWYKGAENLSWAPHNWKGLHTTDQQRLIAEALEQVQDDKDGVLSLIHI